MTGVVQRLNSFNTLLRQLVKTDFDKTVTGMWKMSGFNIPNNYYWIVHCWVACISWAAVSAVIWVLLEWLMDVFTGASLVCLFQNVPQVDDEGYSIRPDNPTQSIFSQNIGRSRNDSFDCYIWHFTPVFLQIFHSSQFVVCAYMEKIITA